jgi:trehalose/maltose transport system substrate-binding protein
MKIGAILGLLLLSVGLNGFRQSSREPVTVTFLDVEYDTPDLLPELGQDVLAFTRETGIQVKRLPGPDGSLNQLVLWRKLLQQGGTTPDLYSIDVIWPGILNQYLMDLKPDFGAALSSEDPVVRASYTVGDKLVAMPHHAYVSVLYYRPDLLKRYGYREPPKTWDELETMATRIQAGERAKGQKDFWGYVWQGAATEDLTCAGLEWQISEGAGRIVEDNKTVSVNNPQTIRAWQRAAHWVGTISPPGVVAYSKWDAENAFGSGKAAFWRGWASDFSLNDWVPLPGGVEQVGVTSIPGGKAGQASTLGGNGLAIARTAGRPREALELIRFLLRRDAERNNGHEHATPPKGLEIYQLPLALAAYPQFAKRGQKGGGLVARPSTVTGERYEDVSRAYIRAAHSVLTGETAPSAAAAALEKELLEITGFAPGLPSKTNSGAVKNGG